MSASGDRERYVVTGIAVGLLLIGWKVWPVAPYCTGEQPRIVAGVSTAPLWADAPTDPTFTYQGREYIHPVYTAWAANAHLEAGRIEEARELADELWMHAEDGWLAYEFDWPGAEQTAPWVSGMAQGEALGVFARLGMMAEADAVYATLRPPVVAEDGWIIEYVGMPQVLNGAIFAIGGLYYYWQATDDPRVLARLERAVAAIARDVHRFRNPGAMSSYWIDRDTRHWNYHLIHEKQLGWLAGMSGMACLERAARDFDTDA